MRVAVLWSELSGYLNACLKELVQTGGAELFVAHVPPSQAAPFDVASFEWIGDRYLWEEGRGHDDFLPRLERFGPDVILCVNWHHREYREALKRFRGRAVRIFASDRPWTGTLRQWLGAATSRFYLHPLCEAIFVPGERQVEFARRMGFKPEGILRGELSCDHGKFAEARRTRCAAPGEPRSFVYVGRFSAEKGIEALVRAYGEYRQASPDPWPLECYGAGPMAHLLDGVEGVEKKGFCQPDDLPGVLVEAGCLLLPSVREAWGVAVHEACAAGVPVIVSDAAGASVHLVQDGYNGYVVEAGNAHALAQAMLRYAALSPPERSGMGEAGYGLSLQFTPQRWARTLLHRSAEMLGRP
ncbi:MAG: glycosyltransferase family 4 protein [Actinomycetota bacterium]